MTDLQILQLFHVLSPKKKLDLGNLRDTWGRSQPFLEHATASTAICESLTALRGDHVGQLWVYGVYGVYGLFHAVSCCQLDIGALDGLGDMRSIINNQYFKVLQSTSKYFNHPLKWSIWSMSGCLLPL
jgi:hypothetical protein